MQGFMFIETTWNIFDGGAYTLSHIELDVRFLDWFVIFVTALLACYLASWMPARAGAKLKTVEGLKYE